MFVSSITIFTARQTGIITVPTVDANAICAAAGQPTSITERLRPNLSAICDTAGARLLPIKPVTRFRPMNPIPTVKPARKDLPKPAPKMQPITQIMIGIITVAPMSLMYWKNPKK